MTKRKRVVDEQDETGRLSRKRSRTFGRNNIDKLSDELLLRTFRMLSVTELVKTEEVCQRFRRLCSDNEIWREKFYNRFVRPRARRLPSLNKLTSTERQTQALTFSSRSARWLGYGPRDGEETDWKRRYKVQLNWSSGRCVAQELNLEYPNRPRILVKILNGIIFTASEQGLASYSQRSSPQLLSRYPWSPESCGEPTAIAVDSRGAQAIVTVGFIDGSFRIFSVSRTGTFVLESAHAPGAGSSIVSLAQAWPHVLLMTKDHSIVLYKLERHDATSGYHLTTVAKLCSQTNLGPVSLAIRRTHDTLIASIAYSFCRLGEGWCLGLQEIRLNLEGDVLESRVVSSVDTPLQDFPLKQTVNVVSRSATSAPFPLHPQLMKQPNALSHSGCYILAGMPDNTLMVYTIVSSSQKLSITGGRRLWGHTSAISGAEVSDRGKALSVSARGDEIRVWELEEMLSSHSIHKASTKLRPWSNANHLSSILMQRGNGLGLALNEMKEETVWLRHWVGFDEEQVVVLGERNQRQTLSCYDFA